MAMTNTNAYISLTSCSWLQKIFGVLFKIAKKTTKISSLWVLSLFQIMLIHVESCIVNQHAQAGDVAQR